MSAALRAGGAVLALALLALLVLGSGAPYTAEPSGDAWLRLSWRAVGEPVQECRAPTEAELAALPAHMRRKEICERRLQPFRLRVLLDGETRVDRLLRATGAREDRPVYVLEEFRIAPGAHQVEVSFEPEATGTGQPQGAAPLALAESFTAESRQILLVKLGESGHALELHAAD